MMEWKKLDEELFSAAPETVVAVYYKDIKYKRYDLTLFLKNLYYSAEAWTDSILNAYKDKVPVCYCAIDLPEIPKEFTSKEEIK